MTCSKHYDLEILICCFQAFNSIRPHIDPCINYFTIRKFNLKNYIRIISFRIINTVNQSFIKIKDDCLLMIMFWRRKLNKSSIEIGCWRRSNCVYVLDCLQCLNQVCFMKLILFFIFLALQNFTVRTWLCSLRKLSIFCLTLFNRNSFNLLFPLYKLNFRHKLIDIYCMICWFLWMIFLLFL